MREIAPASAIRAPGARAPQPPAAAGPVVPSGQSPPPEDSAFTFSASLLRMVGLGEFAATVVSGDDGKTLLQLADGRLFRPGDAGLRAGQRLLLAITGTMDDLVRVLVVAIDGERLSGPRELVLQAAGGPTRGNAGAPAAAPLPAQLPDILSALLLQPVNAGHRRAPLLLPAGTEVRLRPVPLADLAGAPLPDDAAGTGEPLGAGTRLTAVPIQAKSGDRWIYRTALGNLAIRLPPSMVFAPVMELEVVEILPPAAQAQSRSLGGIFSHAVDRWPDFSEALSAGGAAEPLRELTPRLAPRGIERLFAFLAGLRRGDIGRLLEGELGEVMRAQGKENALRRLSEDFRELQRVEREQPGAEWRALALPLAGHERVLPVWFFFRGSGRQRADRQERGARFVIELHLNELGPVQLDGFMREKALDLFLRTHRPLPAAARDDIEAIFHRGLEQAGLSGVLAFQAVTPFPVAPLDMLERGRRGGSIAI